METKKASEGKYLYDGTHVVSVIHAPQGADLSQWQEITKEEGDNIKAEQAKAREAEIEQKKAEIEQKKAEHEAKREARKAEAEQKKEP